MHLIIAKESEERARALKKVLPTHPITFQAEEFDAFLQEIETMPFLSRTKNVLLEGIDQLSKEAQAQLLAYIQRPNPWIVLHLTAASLPAQSKLVKAVDNVIRIKEEKAWEREKRLAEWAVERAAQAGVVMTLTTAQMFVKNVDSQVLDSEIEKLICYVGERKEITLEAIRQLSTPIHHETLWQLGDAIFARQAAQALQVGRRLLHDGMALFPLLAHLRTQFHTTAKIINAFEEGGKPSVAAAFPYLRGGLLDKKVMAAQRYGARAVQNGLVHIFETELKAKNSAVEPVLLLELLLVKVTNDTALTS